jgi:hypothetical protein
MESAKSILLNEKFTPDDDRLNYQAYVNLLLTCNVCGEAVFLKQASDFNKSGIKRAAHFSHYKDTGKNDCCLRTESTTNTRDTDSEGKKQSLVNYQEKIQHILDEGIVYYQKISYLQLKERTDEGESLVNQYKIDINSWLSQFYHEREHIKNLALSLYHNKSSEIECIVFSNIVNYLCVPASEDILKKILYYVFLFNKEVFINNDFEKVFSKAIKLISYINVGQEYQKAQESLTGFNDDNLTENVPEDTNLERETVKPKMVRISSFLGSYETEILETTELNYDLCRPRQSKKGKVFYQQIRGGLPEKISISWHEDKEGEYLTLRNNKTIVATFSLTTDRTIKWNPLPVYFVSQTIIARPTDFYPQYHIVSENLYNFFLQWVNSVQFNFSVTRCAGDSIYPPQFVKLLFLFIAYINERSRLTISTGDGLTLEVNVNPEDVDNIYKELLLKLVGKSKSMKKRYLRSNSPIKKLKVSLL